MEISNPLYSSELSDSINNVDFFPGYNNTNEGEQNQEHQNNGNHNNENEYNTFYFFRCEENKNMLYKEDNNE